MFFFYFPFKTKQDQKGDHDGDLSSSLPISLSHQPPACLVFCTVTGSRAPTTHFNHKRSAYHTISHEEGFKWMPTTLCLLTPSHPPAHLKPASS